jgi:uncharacterized protein (DUF1697 family)
LVPAAASLYSFTVLCSLPSVQLKTMPVLISMLRAVNVGGHRKIKMDALRELCASLKFENPQTYLQSGNVIFKTSERDLDAVAKRLHSAIEKKFQCKTDIMLRTTEDFRTVIKKNPFAKRADVEPGKLVVFFLAGDPGNEARKAVLDQNFSPEELHATGRELYIYFPNGQGKSRLPFPRIYKLLQTPGTGRNWNSVTNMLEMAEKLESA